MKKYYIFITESLCSIKLETLYKSTTVQQKVFEIIKYLLSFFWNGLYAGL